MKRISIKAIALAAMMFALPHTANAATIFNFSGTINQIDGGLQPILQFLVGETFTGSFAMSDPVNSVPATSSSRFFELGDSSFTLAGNTWTASNGVLNQQISGPNEINFWSTNASFGNPQSFSGPTLTPLQFQVESAFFLGFSPDLFDSLESVPDYELNDLFLAFFGLQMIDGTQIQGSIANLTSLEFVTTAAVPVPPAVLFLVTAIAALGAVGSLRRSRRAA